MLDSIFKTIDSIKQTYSNFKIKVVSVQLQKLYECEDEKLAELLNAFNVA